MTMHQVKEETTGIQ